MPKVYNDIIKQQAWTYYVMLGMSFEEISALIEPSARTIKGWAEEADWDKQRVVRTSSPNRIALDAAWMVGMIYKKAREENRILTASEIDQVSKHNKLIERLDKNFAFVSSVIEGQGMFMQFVREKDEVLFQKLIPLNLEFTQALASQIGEL